MTNSYFIEAPDYASILDRSFTSLNASLARQEAMERDNDRRREQNAAVPLQVFEKLIDFSVTAKKAIDKVQAKKWLESESQGASSAALSKIDDEYQQETDDAFQTGTEAYKVETEIEKTALENDDIEIAEQQKFGVGHQVINARDLSVAYLDKMPTSIDLTQIILIIFFSLIISIIATVYPAYKASKTEIRGILNNV